MQWPTTDEVRRVRDLGDGRAGWHVRWPGQVYPGKAVAPVDADAAWVADAVRRFTRKAGSVAVARGRLYSPVDLLAEVREA